MKKINDVMIKLMFSLIITPILGIVNLPEKIYGKIDTIKAHEVANEGKNCIPRDCLRRDK